MKEVITKEGEIDKIYSDDGFVESVEIDGLDVMDYLIRLSPNKFGVGVNHKVKITIESEPVE